MRYILLLIVTALICCAAINLGDLIEAPGSGGMNSRVDINQLNKNESRYTLNANIFEYPGKIKKRNALASFSNNTTRLYGVHGYSNIIWDSNNVFCVADKYNFILSYIDTSANPDTQMYYVFPSDTTVNIMSYSLSGKGNPATNDLPLTLVGGGDYDFCDVREFIVVSDGENIPHVIAPTLDTLISVDDEAHNGDGEYYFPRSIGLGLEAPGQLRATVAHCDEGTERTGLYRYAYEVYESGRFSYCGIPSRWVELKDQNCLVSLFEPHPDSAVGDTTTYLLWRQKYTEPWYILDTITTIIQSVTAWRDVHYIDSLADGVGVQQSTYSNKIYRPNRLTVSYHLVPGAFFNDAETDFPWDSVHHDFTYDTTKHLPSDSMVYIAYSYYDPLTEIESPMGPRVLANMVLHLDAVGNDTVQVIGWQKSVTNIHSRSRWVRCYRSKTIPSSGGVLLSGDDTPDNKVMYGMYELRSNYMNPQNITEYNQIWFPGWGSNADLIAGIDSVGPEATTMYIGADIMRDNQGLVVTRPPYISACEIPFSDVAYANYRLWGIGDPLYPRRLYYNEFDQLHDWSPINYIEIGTPRDVIVAIEAIPFGDIEALLIFTNNSVHLLAGEDVEFDASISIVTTKCGAISRKAIVRTEDEIFFFSPNMKIYSTKGGVPQVISDKIENYIDTIFTDYTTAKANVVAFRLSNKIVFYATDTQLGLSFNLLDRSWQIESYYSKVSIGGSFQHDSTSETGYDERDWWVWQTGIDTLAGPEYDGKKFLREIEASVADTYRTDDATTAYSIPFAYQTSFYGDGEWYYEIRELQFTAKGDSGQYCYLTIYNENEDSLLVDSVIFFSDALTTPEMRGYRTAFTSHEGKRLSVRFWSKDGGTATNVFEISDVKIDLMRKAKNAIN